MDDGEAKTEAIKEMQMAEDMMSKKDMQGCMTNEQCNGGYGEIDALPISLT